MPTDHLLFLFVTYIELYMNMYIYQLPLVFDKHGLSHGMCLYQVMMTLHFLNDVANDGESTQKSKITS